MLQAKTPPTSRLITFSLSSSTCSVFHTKLLFWSLCDTMTMQTVFRPPSFAYILTLQLYLATREWERQPQNVLYEHLNVVSIHTLLVHLSVKGFKVVSFVRSIHPSIVRANGNFGYVFLCTILCVPPGPGPCISEICSDTFAGCNSLSRFLWWWCGCLLAPKCAAAAASHCVALYGA